MASSCSLVWFRRDLRLADNPALQAALEQSRRLFLIYILDETIAPPPGGAARWWLEQSLHAFSRQCKALGCQLVLRRGPALDMIPAFCETHQIKSVYWNRLYEPEAIDRDRKIKAVLKPKGIECKSFNGLLLYEPWQSDYQKIPRVFTPFWRACLKLPPPASPVAAPTRIKGGTKAAIPSQEDTPATDTLADWGLYSGKPDWACGFRDLWSPGEAGAHQALSHFLTSVVCAYATKRDRPDLAGTSRLSPHLSFGEISPRQIWYAVKAHGEIHPEILPHLDKFLSEMGWREFSYSLLCRYPHLPEEPLRSEFADFPWREDCEGFTAWTRGMTGYPIIDAGMRELWQTGYMHNRVRMITASFLIKDLRIPWQKGAAWFWDCLCDADLANNSASWQWVAGCGADAAPYFRIFNPVLQGEKFDPEGVYVRRFVPEISALPNEFIHKPWLAPPEILQNSSITPGDQYPRPILDHARARQTALEAYKALKQR